MSGREIASGGAGRRRRRRWENRAGWWGILRWSAGATAVAVLMVTGAAGLLPGSAAAYSALLGGGVVLVLSALTGATTALAWDHARDLALPLAMGALVAKLALYAMLLAAVPPPSWAEVLPTAAGALAAVGVWQVAEVLVFARTRRSVYGP